MPRTAWFHCFAGIAGDMTFGALLDAGADLDAVNEILARLPVSGWELKVTPTVKVGLGATAVRVLDVDGANVVRTYAHTTGLLEEARLPPRVLHRAQATFAALAEAHGHIRNQPVERLHFHEIGNLAAIIEIVGVCAALEVLDIDEIHSSPVAQGMGLITGDNGLQPNPTPIVVALLAARQIPSFGLDVPHELTTATGAALLRAFCDDFGPLPDMRVSATGYGAGNRDINGMPNVLQVVLGESSTVGKVSEPMVLLEANVDDAAGDILQHCVASLLDAGAADAWLTPIILKRGLMAYTVSALVNPALVDHLRMLLTTETGSLVVRMTTIDRWASTRSLGEVEIEGFPIRVKVGRGRTRAEFDDASKVATRTGLPLRDVLARAEAAWRRAQEQRQYHPSNDRES
jgi:pyridinium-3,5-bisthiocarboxylic acid mononucleotide nickel chelatase